MQFSVDLCSITVGNTVLPYTTLSRDKFTLHSTTRHNPCQELYCPQILLRCLRRHQPPLFTTLLLGCHPTHIAIFATDCSVYSHCSSVFHGHRHRCLSLHFTALFSSSVHSRLRCHHMSLIFGSLLNTPDIKQETEILAH